MKPEPSIILEGMVVLLAAASMAQAASQLPAVPKLRLGDEARPTAYSAELVVLPEQNTWVQDQIVTSLGLLGFCA